MLVLAPLLLFTVLLFEFKTFSAPWRFIGRGTGAGRASPPAANCDDGTATIAGMLPLAFAIGAGSQMLKPLALAVIGGLLGSMILPLIVTPAIQFFLQSRRSQRDLEQILP